MCKKYYIGFKENIKPNWSSTWNCYLTMDDFGIITIWKIQKASEFQI